MNSYFEQLSALPGAAALDSSIRDSFLRLVNDEVIPAIVKAEEKQRLLAAEVRALPTKRVIPHDE